MVSGDVVIRAGTGNGRSFEDLCKARAAMTVENVSPEGSATCVWFDAKDRRYRETFPPDALEVIRP